MKTYYQSLPFHYFFSHSIVSEKKKISPVLFKSLFIFSGCFLQTQMIGFFTDVKKWCNQGLNLDAWNPVRRSSAVKTIPAVFKICSELIFVAVQTALARWVHPKIITNLTQTVRDMNPFNLTKLYEQPHLVI